MFNKNMYIIFALFILLFAACSKPTDTAGGTSSNGNALVAGHLYTSTGAPAVNATIYFIKSTHDPFHELHSISDSTLTNSDGSYAVNDIDTGTYNVFGTGSDGSRSLIESFKVTGKVQTVSNDTLKAPASLTGYIKLPAGGEPDKIIAIMIGSNTFSLISSDGRFTFQNLAEGSHAVKFFSTLDNYSNYDTTFTITAGANIDMLDSVVMPLTIPVPTGITLKYDTLKQIVMLSWNRMDTAKIKGYKLYRQQLYGSIDLLTPAIILDTFYLDSTIKQDSIYVYHIASLNFSNIESYKSFGCTITPFSGFLMTDTLFETSDAIGYYCTGLNGDFFCMDHIGSMIHVYDSTGTFKRSWKTLSPGSSFPSSKQITVTHSFDVFLATEGYGVERYDTLGNLLDTNLTFSNREKCSGFVSFKDTLYFCDVNKRVIIVANSKGDSLFTIKNNWTLSDNLFSIACDQSGNIYVYGLFNEKFQIQVFSNSGVFISEFIIDGTIRSISISQDKLLLLDKNSIKCVDLFGILQFKFSIPSTITNYPVNSHIQSNGNIVIGFVGGLMCTWSRL